MLFNSYTFILLFLPVTVAVFCLLGRFGRVRDSIVWLVVASLFFYGFWNPIYLLLIIGSIAFNYGCGLLISRSDYGSRRRRMFLVLGIAANLGLLGYFKYYNFFSDSIGLALGFNWKIAPIVLPLAISFFTFQQIAYLADVKRNQCSEHDFLRYCLFVTFFPQLIAGPIVHHGEMLPQFARPETYHPRWRNLAIGLTIFGIGLFKKVVLADSISVFANDVFDAAEAGNTITFFAAWGGTLAYTFQLYFDFSGYSDMAIGIARLFGIRLPLNFNSPYKATSIAEFWRRWHMTLSRFLRDYLYIPLGGNRHGPVRRYNSLAITMLLGGLWHGAAWTFVAWGALHGIFLIVNHGWKALSGHLGLRGGEEAGWSRLLSWSITMLCVSVAWVFFRAESFTSALAILSGMAGANGAVLDARLASLLAPLSGYVTFEGKGVANFGSIWGFVWIAALAAIAWLGPNTQEIMCRIRPALETYPGEIGSAGRNWLIWRPTVPWAIACSVVMVMAMLHLTRVREFLYFQF